MIQHQVVIAGGGPTGMMLSAELKLAGIDVAIVERRLTPDIDGSRAGGLHARTLELLDQRGASWPPGSVSSAYRSIAAARLPGSGRTKQASTCT